MDNVSFLIEKLYMEGWLRDEEFLEVLIHHGENEIRNLLAEYARKTAHRYYGNKVYTRGLIELATTVAMTAITAVSAAAIPMRKDTV